MRFSLLLIILSVMIVMPLLLLIPSSAFSQTSSYRPPRDNLELSIICANHAVDAARITNSFIDPDKYCQSTIGNDCIPAGFTLEECYAFFFAPNDSDIPFDVAKSIGIKIEALKAMQDEQ